MNRFSAFSNDDLAGVPPSALVSLTHAFRRDVSNKPAQRERVKMERQRSKRRDFVDMRARKWSLEE
jgi:hypothetical protein